MNLDAYTSCAKLVNVTSERFAILVMTHVEHSKKEYSFSKQFKEGTEDIHENVRDCQASMKRTDANVDRMHTAWMKD